jgi:hypothetical protein
MAGVAKVSVSLTTEGLEWAPARAAFVDFCRGSAALS